MPVSRHDFEDLCEKVLKIFLTMQSETESSFRLRQLYDAKTAVSGISGYRCSACSELHERHAVDIVIHKFRAGGQ